MRIPRSVGYLTQAGLGTNPAQMTNVPIVSQLMNKFSQRVVPPKWLEFI